MRYRRSFGSMNQPIIIDTWTGEIVENQQNIVQGGNIFGNIASKVMGAVTSNIGKELAKTAATKITEGVATQAGKKIGEAVLGKGYEPTFAETLRKKSKR